VISTKHAISAPPARVRLRRELRIDMPAERALHLFTPVGERLWVKGWEPRFPDGERGDGATTGTAFITEHAGRDTVWTVVDRGEHLVRYARTTTGHSAGLVEVRCHAQPDGTTRATVTYELTALDDDARRSLGEFARGYADYIAEWERLIAAALEAGRIRA
jgi:hypothetical protein